MNTSPPQAPDPGASPEWDRPLAVSDLPADRHRILKEHLMSEIRDARDAGTARSGRGRPSWWRHRPVTALIAAAGATAVIAGGLVTARVVTTDGAAPAPTSAVGTPGSATLPVVSVGQASSTGVTKQLQRIALVAARSDVRVRPDQFAYQKSMHRGSIPAEERTFPGEGPMKMTPMTHREIWVSQKSSGGKGLIIDNGKAEEYDQGDLPNLVSYENLAKLPTDPDKLLEWIRAHLAEWQSEGTTPDQQAFNTIGTILEEGPALPAELAAALYQAAARIPGVVLVDKAEDAAGRTGIAVAREDAGARTEWIFDEKTLTYLGVRKVQVKDTEWIKPGMLLSTSAILQRAIVDERGERPTSTS